MRKVTGNLDLILCLVFTIALTGCAASHTEDTTGEYGDDIVITAAVKSKLLDDRHTNGLAIKVETLNGVVHLSGLVDTMEQARRAVDITRSVEGVKSVKNGLVVKGIY